MGTSMKSISDLLQYSSLIPNYYWYFYIQISTLIFQLHFLLFIYISTHPTFRIPLYVHLYHKINFWYIAIFRFKSTSLFTFHCTNFNHIHFNYCFLHISRPILLLQIPTWLARINFITVHYLYTVLTHATSLNTNVSTPIKSISTILRYIDLTPPDHTAWTVFHH